MNQVIAIQVRSPQLGGIIYFSPGVTPGTAPYELWRCENDQAALYWTAPAGEMPTCLFYTELTGQMYMATWHWEGASVINLYAWADGGSPSLLTSFTAGNQISQAAEFQGNIYLGAAGGAYFNPPTPQCWLYRFNPLTEEVSEVFSAWDQSSFRNGGLGVEHGWLYYSGGMSIWRSNDGVDWSGFLPWSDAYGLWSDMYTDEAEAVVYVCGMKMPDANRSLPVVVAINQGVLFEEYVGTNNDVWGRLDALNFGALACVETAGVLTGPFVLERLGWWNDYTPQIGPQWAGKLAYTDPELGQMPPAWRGLGTVPLTISATEAADGQSLVGTGGALYGLFTVQSGIDPTGVTPQHPIGTHLAKCPGGTGAWQSVHFFPGYEVGGYTGKSHTAMGLWKPGRMCHQV